MLQVAMMDWVRGSYQVPASLWLMAAFGCGGEAASVPADRGEALPQTDEASAPPVDAPDPTAPPITPEPPVEMEEPEPFVGPGCPFVEPPTADLRCDPFAMPSDCGEGETCNPFVLPPQSPCDVERFGTRCQPFGDGLQGDSCRGAGDCAASYTCVITGRGTQCVRLCGFERADECDAGFLCLPIDIDGFGGCL